MQKYSILEQKIVEIFNNHGSFNFQGEEYDLDVCDKPKSRNSGEPKTDVYIRGHNSWGSIELKISVKSRSTNEFQGNKLNAETAENLFGIHYRDIIRDSIRSIEDRFLNSTLIFGTNSSGGRRKPNSITLGWKLEVSSKERTLSVPLNLSDQDIKDYIYKGIDLPLEKRDALVNGQITTNSGIADFILYSEIEELQSPDDVLHQMQLIDDTVFPPTYLIFTANSYRTEEDSTDGNRPLCIPILWKINNGRLDRHIGFDRILEYRSNDMKNYLLHALDSLGKRHPDEFDPSNDLVDPQLFY